MADKIRGVVIESHDSKDSDKDVLLFTLQNGKIWATLVGVRKEKAKLKVAKQTFCFADFFIETKGSKNIITSIDVIETFSGLSQDLNKYYEACGICEIVKKSMPYGFADSTLFLIFVKALKNICYSKTIFKYTITKFLLDIFKFTGYGLDNEFCHNCGAKIIDFRYIDFKVGDLVCSKCKSFYHKRVSKAEFAIMRIFSYTPYEKLETVKIDKEPLQSLLNVLVQNYEERYSVALSLFGVM